MKTLEIKIKTLAQANAEFIETWEAVEAGKKVKPQIGVYFTSLDAVRALLTEQRMALLHAIRKHHPKSISELARLVGRDFKNVYTDIALLRRYGLVKLGAGSGKGRPASRAVTVPYQAINIHAAV